MIGTLGDYDDFALQLALWSHVISGDVCELGATIAESRDFVPLTMAAWDRTSKHLEYELVSHGDGDYRRVKDWAAIPYITEHIMRGHAEWPGL